MQAEAIVERFLAGLGQGATPDAGLLAPGVEFLSLNVRASGPSDVLARLADGYFGPRFANSSWSAPKPTPRGFEVIGTPPQGSLQQAVLLLVNVANDQIVSITHQNLPVPPMSASPLKLTPELKEVVDSSEEISPATVAYVDEAGQPHLSYRGSTRAFSDDQLSIWLRSATGGIVNAVKTNPRLSILIRLGKGKPNIQFHGRAWISTDEGDRDRVYEKLSQSDKEHDFARAGAALIIDLDRVDGYMSVRDNEVTGRVLMARGA
jgi:general stress protein 26